MTRKLEAARVVTLSDLTRWERDFLRSPALPFFISQRNTEKAQRTTEEGAPWERDRRMEVMRVELLNWVTA